jgi:hypothetical protein
LPHLTAKSRLISAEPLEYAVVEIGKLHEAPRNDVLRFGCRRGIGEVAFCAAAFIGPNFGRLAKPD